MREITYRDALAEALKQEMRRDPRIFAMAEDIINIGGGFGEFKHIWEEFGDRRAILAPISESAIVGACVGAALVGLRPVGGIMFADLTTIAMDHIVNSAAKVRYLHGGEPGCPIVLLIPTGVGHNWDAHHAQSLEAWFVHVPGLKVVIPSTPHDAKGLLIAALRDDDPVLVFEPKLLFDVSGPVPEEEYVIPLAQGEVKREGDDVTVVAIGLMVQEALKAAEQLAEDGVSVEVIDPRTLKPLDKDIILSSVKKTRRLVVAHEGCKTGGLGAEIAATIGEEAFWVLDAPIVRVASPDIPVPFSPVMMALYRPDSARISQAVLGLVR